MGGGSSSNYKITSSKKKYVILGVLAVFGLTLLLSGSYAVLTKKITGSKNYTLATGDLDFSISNETNAITLSSAYPMTDYEGSNLTPYTFTLKNTGSQRISYQIKLIQDKTDTSHQHLTTDKIKFELVNGADITGPVLLSSVENIATGIINPSESLNFELRIWLDYDVTLEDANKIFKSKIEVSGTQYISNTYAETILNGANPVLTENLVPITIDDDGTVKKADINSEWYSYENKKWANAVVLVDKTMIYKNGDIISENNIESYFVWIPKYSYKLFNLGNYNSLTSVTNAEQTIDVKFGLTNTSGNNSGECTTPMVSGETGTCKVGDYMTHPAFISMNTNGLWVGKFETGYKGATSVGTAMINSNDSNKIVIKPNTYSWRNIQISNSFTSSYNYLRESDSHMMKNTEWGAVAYLQHSKYGSQASVRINNNNSYLTGYAATEEPTLGYTGVQCTEIVTEDCNVYGTSPDITQPYNTSTGYTASTTGNITGIYDMSGGAYEPMMGVLGDTDGNPVSGRSKTYNAGFKGNYSCPTCDSNTEAANTTGKDFPNEKYYDVYKYGTGNRAFVNRILGDATGEMGPFANAKYGNQTRTISSWYADNSYFVNSSNPWFSRGGYWINGSDTGVFYSHYNSGTTDMALSFRVVLAP